MNRRIGLTGLCIALIVVAVVSGLAWFTLGLIRDQTRRDLGHMLNTTLTTTHEALQIWGNERKDEATAWANEPELIGWTKALLSLPHKREALLASPALSSLRKRMVPMITAEGFLGLFVIAPDYANLASMRDANVGLKNLLAGRQHLLDDVFSGETRISLPFASDVPLRDSFGLMREHYPTMFVATPLKDESGAIIAALALRIDPAKNFTRIAQLGRVGETGETYLFDNSAHLITESRFDDKLRQVGLLPPESHAILNVEIRDPGAAAALNIKMPVSQPPLTLMAQSAIAGQAGQNLDGYRNYRGLSVIGVWRWDEHMEYGLATEITVDEAYASFRGARQLVFALLAATLLLSLGLSALAIWLQRRGAQRLRESRMQLSAILETAPDAVISIDETQRMILFNKGAERTFGYGHDEILGQPLNVLIPQQYHSNHQKLVQGFSASDASARYMQDRGEITCQHKSGKVFLAEASISKTQKGGKHILTVILRDISERRLAEAALKESEQRFRAIFETIQDIYYRTDMAGQVTHMSPSCLRMTGYAQQELIGTDITAYYADPDQRNALMQALQNSGAVNDFEIKMVHKDGTSRIASVTSHFVCDHENHPVAVEGIVRDITERIQDQTALRQSLVDTKQAEVAALNMMEDAHAARVMAEQGESEMEKLAVASRNMAGLRDIAEIYALICNAALEIFDLKLAWLGLIEETSAVITPVATSGISSAYVSGIAVRRDDRPEGCGPSGRAVKTGRPQVEHDIEHDPSFQQWRKKVRRYGFRSMLAIPLIDVNNKVIGVLHLYSHETGFFIENRVNMIAAFASQAETAIESAGLLASLEQRVKRRTLQLEIARDQAQASNRAKSTFLANMSHELRTPLNSILGFAELLSLDKLHPLHPEQVSQLGFVLESGSRLLNLINDLLDLSKIEAGRMKLDVELFDVKGLLNHAIKHHVHAVEQQGLTVHSDYADDVALCYGDMQKIHQVLDNLLSNAIKFTPAGGVISVQAKVVGSEEEGVRREVSKSSSSPPNPLIALLKISIIDTGIGIAETDYDKLFQPFQQLDGELNRQYEGTGLGLSLCRKIIAMHGGDIWLEQSEQGKGSTFTFVIPVGEADA